MVYFWPNNIPYGFGEKAVPKAKIASVIFSRLQNAQNIQPRPAILGHYHHGQLCRKTSRVVPQGSDESILQQDLRFPVRLASA
jgi:hypothetical protein